ncbi:hypothetical protein O181_022652 [Austropuccinia psidii MF-1]|uniref:Uncharacterized protein n=1 Tax=Austropuccinia psidii MF-1 TaxID=1389203 RepID=A0A9Q3GXB7_9BASI|nr:hypothetical protein [Austropuccinia psidii MF-1]
MRRDRFISQERDGGYIVPEMKVLKSYIEKELEFVIIATERLENKISQDEFSYPNIDKAQQNKVQFEYETMENSLHKLKYLNRKIKEQQRPRIPDQEEKRELKDFIQKLKGLT